MGFLDLDSDANDHSRPSEFRTRQCFLFEKQFHFYQVWDYRLNKVDTAVMHAGRYLTRAQLLNGGSLLYCRVDD